MTDEKERDPESYAVIGAAMEVHSVLGSGFLEAVYQEAMEIELESRGVPFRSQPDLRLHYKNRELRRRYVPDFVCYDGLVVELKAEKRLTNVDEAQIINALKCAEQKVGLLINFGEASLVFRRFVN